MEDKKINSATRAKKKYNAKTYHEIKLVVKKEDLPIIDARAKELGIPRATYIKELIGKDLDKKI